MCAFALSVLQAPWEVRTPINAFDERPVFSTQTIFAPPWDPPNISLGGEARILWSSLVLTWAAMALIYYILLKLLTPMSQPDLAQHGLEAEFVDEKIISCPICGFRNRTLSNTETRSYRCQHCHSRFHNPEIRPPSVQWHWRWLKLVLVAIAVCFCIFALLMREIQQTVSTPIQSSPQKIQGAHKRVNEIDEFEAAFDRQLAESRAPQKRSLPNGTFIHRLDIMGTGVLEIENGTARDAVLKIVDMLSDRAICSFYVSHNHSFRETQMPDRTCRLIFALGVDWDKVAGRFMGEQSFAEFDQNLDFSAYSEYRLTLHKVVSGNAKTHQLKEADFLKY